MSAGEDIQGVYFLKKGFLRLYSVSSEGEEFTLIIFRPGDIFPVSWAIADIKSNYFLEALTRIEVWRAQKSKFVELASENPDVLLEILNKITVRLMSVLRRMEYLVFGDACNKVASILLILSERFGEKTKTGVEIKVPLTHKDIAALLGVARETVSLEMENLKEKGIIEYSRKIVSIKSPIRLKRESQLGA